MPKKLTACFIVAVVILGGLGCTRGDKQVLLRYKFIPGLKLTWHQSSKRDVKKMVGDSTVFSASSKLDATIVQKVEEVYNDGSALITEIDTWRYEKPSKDDSMIVDTVEDVRTLSMKLRPNGKIEDLQFHGEESQAKISYIKNYYEQGLPVFPTEEVSPGYSWTQTTKVILPDGNMEASTTYKVKAFVRENGYDCAVVECNGNLIIPLTPDPQDTLMVSGIDRIQTTGKLYFAYKEGFVVLQRDHWIIDGDREKLVNGKKEQYKIAVVVDVDFSLQDKVIE